MKFLINNEIRSYQWVEDSERHECKLAIQLYAVVTSYLFLRDHLDMITAVLTSSIVPGEYDVELSCRFSLNGREYGAGHRFSALEIQTRRDSIDWTNYVFHGLARRIATMI